ncbi:hypothetical protein [Zhihengliuella salsuginis]|uniref:Serine/threonine protein kinase n=1 Tax=Zhihengliuella salsuginis TaxID=578222 RepID=A0ABQ3GKE6_9MICC|nr:hypothetical protein [Zhihengliuella salsuginis]GHD07914.1 hypothetical protein GCM10008096_19210 [Zhihengliuella salsuginis]
MGYSPETRKHARSRWVVAVYVAVGVFVVGALIALAFTVMMPRSPAPAPEPTGAPPSSAQVSPVSPSAGAESPGGPSALPTEGLPEPGGQPGDGEPRPADWVGDSQIRVQTFGSSSCPARLERVEATAADELTVYFDSDYGNQACTMDYVGTEHIVDVPEEADGRPLMVRVVVEQ